MVITSHCLTFCLYWPHAHPWPLIPIGVPSLNPEKSHVTNLKYQIFTVPEIYTFQLAAFLFGHNIAVYPLQDLNFSVRKQRSDHQLLEGRKKSRPVVTAL